MVRITLQRPSQGNRLTLPEIEGLTRCIVEAGSRRHVALIALDAGGPDFCLGRDASDPKRLSTAPSDVHHIILSAYGAMRSVPPPVVVYVQGQALGFGAALVAACDLAYAAPSSRFALPEVEAGFAPTLAMSALLSRLPPSAVLHRALTAVESDAPEALRLGWVDAILERAAFDDVVARLAQRPASVMRAAKQFARRASPQGGPATDLLASLLLTHSRQGV